FVVPSGEIDRDPSCELGNPIPWVIATISVCGLDDGVTHGSGIVCRQHMVVTEDVPEVCPKSNVAAESACPSERATNAEPALAGAISCRIYVVHNFACVFDNNNDLLGCNELPGCIHSRQPGRYRLGRS